MLHNSSRDTVCSLYKILDVKSFSLGLNLIGITADADISTVTVNTIIVKIEGLLLLEYT